MKSLKTFENYFKPDFSHLGKSRYNLVLGNRGGKRKMFKVELQQKIHYWNRFVFAFESLEEAQKFVESAMSHFIKEDTDDEDMVISIEFRQKFITAEEEENESSISD